MLYDPKWNKPTVAGIIAFLATKPADEEYDYALCFECAAAQYMLSIGRGPDTMSHWALAEELPKGAYGAIFACGRWTYGAALERAREFEAS